MKVPSVRQRCCLNRPGESGVSGLPGGHLTEQQDDCAEGSRYLGVDVLADPAWPCWKPRKEDVWTKTAKEILNKANHPTTGNARH